MPLIFNNTEVETVEFNGVDLDEVYFNGVKVFEKSQSGRADMEVPLPYVSNFYTCNHNYPQGLNRQYQVAHAPSSNNVIRVFAMVTWTSDYWFKPILLAKGGTYLDVTQVPEGWADDGTTETNAKTVDYNGETWIVGWVGYALSVGYNPGWTIGQSMCDLDAVNPVQGKKLLYAGHVPIGESNQQEWAEQVAQKILDLYYGVTP